MHANIQLAIAGSAAGTLAALLASGLIIKFRCSGVLDLSHGAVATLGAYLFIWTTETLNWPTWVGIVLGIVAAGVASGLFQAFVVRPARNLPILSKLVASLGLMLLITSALPSLFGRPEQSTHLVSGNPIGLGFGRPEFRIAPGSALIVVVTLVLTVALALAYRFTRFGRLTVGVSDNERMVQLLGYSSQRIELLNWVLGGALAGVAGILFSSLLPPTSTSLTEVLMSALAIALLTGFRSFAGMLVIGVLVGMAQAILLRYGSDLETATHLTGWGEAVPLVLIIGSMLLRGRTTAPKGQRLERPLPAAPLARYPLRNATAALALGLLWLVLIPTRWVDASTESLIMTMMALSLVVIVGYTGQVSLAQLTLAGIGGYIAAKVAAEWGLAFPLPILLAGLAAVPFALVIGTAAVRVRGMALAIVSLAFAIVADDMFFNSSLTGASAGMKMTPTSIFGLKLDGVSHERSLAVLVLVIAVGMTLGVQYLRRSPLGLRMLGIRANERGAAAAGVAVARTKLIGFMIGGLMAGMAGSLEAYREVQVSWSAFSFMNSILLLAFVFLAGSTYTSGAWVAGLVINGGLISSWLTFQGNGEVVMSCLAGFAVMAVVLVHPSGLGYDLKRIVGLVWSLPTALTGRHGPEGPVAAPSVKSGDAGAAARPTTHEVSKA